MAIDEKNYIIYEIEEKAPKKVNGEYLVSVRNNDEARLILGLELGKEYRYGEVHNAWMNAKFEAQINGATEADMYRIGSCLERLNLFDPLVVKNKKPKHR